MKKMILYFGKIRTLLVAACLAVCVAFFCAACGGDEPENTNTPPAPPPEEQTEVRLNASMLELDVFDTFTLTVIEGAGENTAWSSTNEAVATVSGGVVTAKAAGNCEIKVQNDNGSASCTVSVYNSYTAPVLKLSGADAVLALGGEYVLSPKLIYKGADRTAEVSFAFSTSDSAVLTLQTENNECTVTGAQYGAARVLVYAEYAGVPVTRTVNVAVRALGVVFDALNMQPTESGYAVSISAMATEPFSPVVRKTESGASADISNEISYESADEKIVRIDGRTFVPTGNGVTTVTATYQGNTFTVKVTVTKPNKAILNNTEYVEVNDIRPVTFSEALVGALQSVTVDGTQVQGAMTASDELTLTADSLNALPISAYGKNVPLVVETDKMTYTASIKLYTLVIENENDYKMMGTLSKAVYSDNPMLFGGYFILGNSIRVKDPMVEFIDRDGAQNGIKADGTQGFRGVFDGNGYCIDGLTRSGSRGNAFITVLHADGIIKNVGFTNAVIDATGGSFLVQFGGGTIQNVFIEYKQIKRSPQWGATVMQNAASPAMKVENLFIDASETVYDDAATGNNDYTHFAVFTRNASQMQVAEDGLFVVYKAGMYIGSTGGSVKAATFFTSYSDFKTAAADKVRNWNVDLWHVDTASGKVTFGTPYIAPPPLETETIEVAAQYRQRIELDIQNSGALNAKAVALGLDDIGTVSEKIGNEYTIASVNGTNVSGTVPAKVFGYAYGEQNVDVVVEADKLYTVKLPVLLVSKVIKTKADYDAWNVIAKACEADGNTWGGYFELGNDITIDGAMNQFIAYNQTGFKGTFDGCGYVLDGVIKTVSAISSGFIGAMSGGTLKNIGFTNAQIASDAHESAFLVRNGSGTVENVYVSYSKLMKGSTYTMTAKPSGTLTVSHLFIDGSGISNNDTASYTKYFYLVADGSIPTAWGVYAIGLSDDYSLDAADGWGNDVDARVYKDHAALKADTTAFADVSGWGEYWHVNTETGEVHFGKNYVPPVTEEINVPTRQRVVLDIHNDGTLNSAAVDLGLDTVLEGKGSYKIRQVNGNKITANTVPASIFGFAYGEHDSTVIAETATHIYTIHMPVLLVSKVITTVADYNAWGVIAKACEADANKYGGYFELGNDISDPSGSIAINAFNKANPRTSSWVTVNGQGGYAGNEAEGFAGTFDGCGYTIDGLTSNKTSNLETFVGALLPSGTLKNIGLTNVSMLGCKNGANVLLSTTYYGTIENVYVHYKTIDYDVGTTNGRDGDYATQDATVGVSAPFATAVIKHVFVDASDVTCASYGFAVIGNELCMNKTTDTFGLFYTGYSENVSQFTSWSAPTNQQGFATFAALKANTNAWTAVQKFAEDSGYWHVNTETGEVTFGRTE